MTGRREACGGFSPPVLHPMDGLFSFQTLNTLEDIERWCRFFLEDPSGPLISNDPTDKHSKESHRLPVSSGGSPHIVPPSLNIALGHPSIQL